MTTSGKGRRSKIIYVDVFLPLINEMYERYGAESLREGDRNILAMFISRLDEAEELGKENERVMKFIKILNKMKKDKKEMKEYEEFSKTERDFFIKGEWHGREEGREETRIETAVKLLRKGIPLAEVQEITELPANKIEQIITLI